MVREIISELLTTTAAVLILLTAAAGARIITTHFRLRLDGLGYGSTTAVGIHSGLTLSGFPFVCFASSAISCVRVRHTSGGSLSDRSVARLGINGSTATLLLLLAASLLGSLFSSL